MVRKHRGVADVSGLSLVLSSMAHRKNVVCRARVDGGKGTADGYNGATSNASIPLPYRQRQRGLELGWGSPVPDRTTAVPGGVLHACGDGNTIQAGWTGFSSSSTDAIVHTRWIARFRPLRPAVATISGQVWLEPSLSSLQTTRCP